MKDLQDWGPAIVAATCPSTQLANALKDALEAQTEPAWEARFYEKMFVARRQSVFDTFNDATLLSNRNSDFALVVAMTCHMAVNGMDTVVVAVVDVGRLNDYAWLAAGVEKHKARIVMGHFGEEL